MDIGIKIELKIIQSFCLFVYLITGLLELPWIKSGNGYRKRNIFGGYAMNWVSQMYIGGN